MSRLADLARRWRELAAELRTLAAEPQARALEHAAAQLEAELAAADAELLSLEAAALESGYSVRQLRHLIAKGDLPNAGRKHAPRVRRGDLPRKGGAAAPQAPAHAAGAGQGFDPDAFAMELHTGHRRPA
jgi:multidrug efflux pump subunit AcrA (membrane-fusion protein)